MSIEKKVNRSTIRLVKDDLTNMDVEAIVFYAQPDLQLGAGFGNAISIRGGPTIGEELKQLGTVEVGEAVVTAAGELKAKHIIHAVGPRFQEEDTEGKLRTTTLNALKRAEEKGIEQIAFPPMGCGFYGVSLATSARITMGAIEEYLKGETRLKELIICVCDSREYPPFKASLNGLG